jgi:hypothetical protein
MREQRTDILIVGGSTGGCAAAMAAASMGYRVLMTEVTDWIGGQLTSQAVPPDEHRWIEQFGCTRRYRQFRDGVRQYYRDHYPLLPSARADRHLNPGQGSVSRICHEPRVALAVLRQMLAYRRSTGHVQVLLEHKPVAVDTQGDRVCAVTLEDLRRGDRVTVSADCVLDATELGDLLPLAKVEYVIGAESQDETGEPRQSTLFSSDTEPRPVSLWLYRRIVARQHYPDGAMPHEVTLVNWPQHDYWEGNIIDKLEDEVARYLEEARQLSLSLLYWLQTEAPRPDGGEGYPGLYLRPDMVGTDDGLAKYPYIRESRRIRAAFTVIENHVGTEARQGKEAEVFPDSVGVGCYRIDLHPSTGGDNYIDTSSLPFQIPLGALIPVRVENLLPACKNIGTTHITNGCYRLHPVEWNIGEAAGLLAAFGLSRGVPPRAVRERPNLLADFQALLRAQGVELAWPHTRPV